jgi:hypothetical protein
MVENIKQHVAPGERALVICKKTLVDAERVPDWPDGDERFRDPDSYTKRFEWDIEGRKLCAVHWGTGIGSNAWKDADVVLLFDEFFLPRSAAIAHTQGYREHKADEGDLATMGTLNSKAAGVDIIALGHRLSNTKQLALRGRARSYDEHGICGRQKLVVACELKTFMAHVSALFPGAKVQTTGVTSDAKLIDQVIAFLNSPTVSAVVTTKEIGEHIGRAWGKVSKHLMGPEFFSALDGIGWRYVSQKGRGGSRFERLVPELANYAAGEALAA